MKNFVFLGWVYVITLFISNCSYSDVTIQTKSKAISVTPIVSASSAYQAADAVGGKMIFAGVTSLSKTGVLQSVVVVDEAEQGAQLSLVCFDRDFTATSDNGALNISDTDAVNIVFVVDIPAASYVDIGGSKVVSVSNIGQGFATHNGDAVYCQMMTSGTPTYAATDDLKVTLFFLQD